MPEQTVVENGYTIEIAYDLSCPESPRSWDNIGTILGWDDRLASADENPYRDPQQWLEDMLPDHPNPTVADLPGVCKTIRLYDHGGVAYYHTETLNIGWDWRTYGYSYVSDEKLVKEGIVDKDGRPDHEWANTILDLELETYQQWAEGDIWQFRVYRNCSCCGQPIKDDNCEPPAGGFYSAEDALAEGRAHAARLSEAPQPSN